MGPNSLKKYRFLWHFRRFLLENPYYIFDKCCDNIRLLDQPSTSSVSGSNLGRPRRDDELDGVVLSTAPVPHAGAQPKGENNIGPARPRAHAKYFANWMTD